MKAYTDDIRLEYRLEDTKIENAKKTAMGRAGQFSRGATKLFSWKDREDFSKWKADMTDLLQPEQGSANIGESVHALYTVFRSCIMFSSLMVKKLFYQELSTF